MDGFNTAFSKIRRNKTVRNLVYNNSFRRGQQADETDNDRKSNSSKNKCLRVCYVIFKVLTSHVGLILFLLLYTLIGAAIFQAVEDNEQLWDYQAAMFYCFTVYTTIGYGFIRPITTGGRILTMLYAIFGIPLCYVTLTNIGIALSKLLKFTYTKIVNKVKRSRNDQQQRSDNNPDDARRKGNPATTSDDDAAATNSDDCQTEDTVTDNMTNYILLTVTFIFIVLYILLGAIMFMHVENWTYFEAIYFLFISFSTIGFGDLSPSSSKFFFLFLLYMMIGLSAMSMLVSFVVSIITTSVAKAKEKVKVIAKRKLGIQATQKPERAPNFQTNNNVL